MQCVHVPRQQRRQKHGLTVGSLLSMQNEALIFLTFQLVDILCTLLMDSQHITQNSSFSTLGFLPIQNANLFAEFGQNLVYDTFP